MVEIDRKFTEYFQSLSPEERKGVTDYGLLDMAKDAGKAWWKGRKKKWPFRDMTEEEMIQSIDPFGAMLKPVAFAKLLKGAAGSATFSMGEKKIYSGLDLPQVQHLTDLLKVPTKEFKGLKAIDWNPALPSTTAGQFGIKSKKMRLNPARFGEATARHEFVHKRQWLPKAESKEVMLSNYIRALRGALFKNKSYRYGIDPVEVQAYAVEDLLRKGRGWSSAFKETLKAQRIYEPAEQVLGSEATALLRKVVSGAGDKYLSEFKLLEGFSK